MRIKITQIIAALRPWLWLLLAWMVAFAFFRGVLVIATWHLHGDATPRLLASSFLHGLRFDLSVAVKLALPFALWRLWRPQPKLAERRIGLAIFGLVAVLALFTLTAEVEFYKEFQMRLGPLAFEYFGTPEDNQTVAGMIWHGYPVVRWTLFCLVVAAGFIWLGWQPLRRESTSFGWPARLVATVLVAFLTVVGWRGGLQQTPLRWGDAIFSQNAYPNHMAQNGVFALMDTLKQRKAGRKGAEWTRLMPAEEATSVLREITLLPGETLVDPQRFPLLRRSPPSPMPVVKRPRNVVLVMMESFSARFCGATGASYGATPHFDELARHGVLFDRAFSVSTHTAQGVYGILCSMPNVPGYDPIMKLALGAQNFRTLPTVLGECGFANVFLYNGLFSWDNKEGFFRHQGVERFIGRYDYVNPSFVDPDWGVSDLDVFRRANEEFTKQARTKRPFLGLVLTLSNHAPFNLPKIEGLEWIHTGDEQEKRVNGVHYADWAVGQFIAEAKRTPWFDETLFIFVGDHGFGIPPVLTEAAILHQHVPLLFYGPGVLGETGEVRHQVASHIDILPTIVGLLGAEVAHQSFGRDLFSLSAGDPGHAWLKASGSSIVAYVEGDDIAIETPKRPATLQKFDLGFPPHASEHLAAQQPERAKELAQRLRAQVVTGIRILEKRLAAPN